jgi:hemerythrin
MAEMIEKIEWSDKYLTGIGAIDRDHRNLFNILEQLDDAEAGAVDFADLFEQMVHYVDTHFAAEEDMMLSLGYPDLENHIIAHQELAATVHRMADLYRTDPGAVSHDEVLGFVTNWLCNHVLKVDMDYVPYLKGGGKKPGT